MVTRVLAGPPRGVGRLADGLTGSHSPYHATTCPYPLPEKQERME
jgi:hypothetical protein